VEGLMLFHQGGRVKQVVGALSEKQMSLQRAMMAAFLPLTGAVAVKWRRR